MRCISMYIFATRNWWTVMWINWPFIFIYFLIRLKVSTTKIYLFQEKKHYSECFVRTSKVSNFNHSQSSFKIVTHTKTTWKFEINTSYYPISYTSFSNDIEKLKCIFYFTLSSLLLFYYMVSKVCIKSYWFLQR